MKKILILLFVCCSCIAHAQLTVNNSVVTITSGATVSIDGLILVPSSTLNITNNTIAKVDSAVTINGVASIKKKYTLTNPITITGVVGIRYNASELNNNNEPSLQIAYSLFGNAYSLSTTSSTNTSGSYYITDNFNNTSFKTLTAATQCTPTFGSTSITACNSYTWNGTTYNASGTYTFNTTNIAGCDSIATLVLTINNATYSYDTTNVCSSQLPYTWNGLVYTSAGTKSKMLTNSRGCDSVATLTVNVGNAVTPMVSISGSSTICSNSNVTYTANPTNEGAAPTYQWKKNGITTGTGSTITFVAGSLISGDAISCIMTANNACQTNSLASSNSITTAVIKSPVAATIVSQYGNTTTAYTNCVLGTITSLYPSISDGVWSSSNSNIVSVIRGGSNTYTALTTANSNGIANVLYTLTTPNSNCTATSSVTVTVAQQSMPNSIIGSSQICVGTSKTYTTSSTGGVWSTTGRMSINQNGIATGINAGNTNIAYTITNAAGCTASTSLPITINALPATPTIAYASGTTGVTGSGGICKNKTFTLVGNPSGGSWSSTLININSLTGVVNTGNTTGTASVTYTYVNSNGCSSSRTVNTNIVACASKGIKNNDLLTNNFTLYPNPVHSTVYLKVDKLINNGTIVITDLYGKQLKQQSLSFGINTIDVSNLAKGMYLVSIITENGKQTQKMVVE